MDTLELAAFRARQAVQCAANPRNMPSANLQVDAALAQSQLSATLPRQIDTFVSRSDNAGLPLAGGYPIATQVIPVNGSGDAVPDLPAIFPQTIEDSSALIRQMQLNRGSCAVMGGQLPPRIPCQIAPGWGWSDSAMNSGSAGSAAAGALGWIRDNSWLAVALAGAAVYGLSHVKRGGGRW